MTQSCKHQAPAIVQPTGNPSLVMANLFARQPIKFQTKSGRNGAACGTDRKFDRRAFTLLELIVALLASSMLLVGLASALFITMQATQPDLGGHESCYQTSEAVVELASELRFAQTFSERTDTSVEFTVADRTGDTNADTIRWEWSGIAGDPLTRQINGGIAANVLQDVHEFKLSYLIRAIESQISSSGEVTSDEFLLADFEGWDGVTPSVRERPLGPDHWVTEYFVAQGFPPEVLSVSITRVEFRMRQSAGGTVFVSIHKPLVSGEPQPETNSIGAATSVDATSLPVAQDWVNVPLSDVTIDGLQEEFVIVLKGSMNFSAYVEHLYSRFAPTDTPVMLYTSDSGSTWDPNRTYENDLLFRAYGTYTTLSETSEPIIRYFVVSSEIAAQAGTDANFRRTTTTDIVNRPEVIAP